MRSIPKRGSRDVHELLDRVSAFPYTKDVKIHFTTFYALRDLALRKLAGGKAAGVEDIIG